MDFVYDLFTVQNKIPLHSNSLVLLQHKTNSQLHYILESYKFQHGNTYLTFEQFNLFLQSLNTKFKINEITKKTFYEKLLFLQSKNPEFERTKLVNLKDKKCTIFGMYNENGMRLIDESGSIQIKWSKESCLTDGVFIFCSGRKVNDFFIVDDVHFPRAIKDEKSSENGLVLFFSGNVALNKMKVIVESFEPKPEVIIFVCDLRMYKILLDLAKIYECINFISMLIDINNNLIPYKEILSNNINNLHIASNPCDITLFNRKIIIVKDDILNNLKKGTTLFNSTELFDIISSQYSYSFRKMGEYFYDSVPDLLLINEGFNEINLEVNGCRFVVCGDFDNENGVFLVYNTIDNSVDASQFPY